jgi:thioredoxin 1
MVNKTTSKSFSQDVSSGITFVDFYAEWCQPCKLIATEYLDLSSEYSESSFLKVDITEESELSNGFKIKSIPTIIAFKNGKVIDRHTGSKGLSSFISTVIESCDV